MKLNNVSSYCQGVPNQGGSRISRGGEGWGGGAGDAVTPEIDSTHAIAWTTVCTIVLYCNWRYPFSTVQPGGESKEWAPPVQFLSFSCSCRGKLICYCFTFRVIALPLENPGSATTTDLTISSRNQSQLLSKSQCFVFLFGSCTKCGFAPNFVLSLSSDRFLKIWYIF